jgi:hypothetical protein
MNDNCFRLRNAYSISQIQERTMRKLLTLWIVLAAITLNWRVVR